MPNLIEAMTWTRFPVPAGAATGQIELAVGQVGKSAPVALVTAGIHGDEGPWGSWAIHNFLSQTSVNDLRGTLRVVPVANPLAMEADTRNAPLDVLDLNRVFPGDARGSHTEQLAATLVRTALDGVDVAIDLHGGGSWCVNAFAFRFAGSEPLAEAFDPPFLITGPDRNVTLTGYARSQGARVAAVEMGGRSADEAYWADRIAAGLRNALGVAGVLSPLPAKPFTSIPVGPTTVLRPPRGGIFAPELREKSVGQIVPADTVLGHLLDPITHEIVETFRAPFSQTAVLLLRPALARVEGGAMLYVVSTPI